LLSRKALSVFICLSGVSFSQNPNKIILKSSPVKHSYMSIHLTTHAFGTYPPYHVSQRVDILVVCTIQYEYHVILVASLQGGIILLPGGAPALTTASLLHIIYNNKSCSIRTLTDYCLPFFCTCSNELCLISACVSILAMHNPVLLLCIF
jgi:hypothetical protein